MTHPEKGDRYRLPDNNVVSVERVAHGEAWCTYEGSRQTVSFDAAWLDKMAFRLTWRHKNDRPI